MSVMEQINALENRIEKAIEMIKALRAENAQLKANLSNAKVREEELEGIVSSLKSGNIEVETGLADVIKIFDDFEKAELMSNPHGTTTEIKDAAREFSFATPAEDTPLNIDIDSEDNTTSDRDQLNIF